MIMRLAASKHAHIYRRYIIRTYDDRKSILEDQKGVSPFFTLPVDCFKVVQEV
jgi:hypothetical protein